MPRNRFVQHGRPRGWAGAAAVLMVTTALFAAACGTSNAKSGGRSAAAQSTAPAPTPTATYKPAGTAGNWKLIFDDEFSSTRLDTSKWSTGWQGSGITAPVNASEEECYDPAQVAQSGGFLNLSLITKSESCGIADPQYASGIVTTKNKFSYTYGFLQARVWLPSVTGQQNQIADWPAVWTDGFQWPTDGEDDIIEGIKGLACAHFHSATSPGGIAPADGTADVSAVSGCVNLTGGWHVFGADWEPGSVTYYYDGKNIGSVTSGVTSAPMYVILDYASGPPYQSPSTMKVDYVRVWKKGSTSN